MVQMIKKIIKNKKYKTIVVLSLCILCISALGFSIQLIAWNDVVDIQEAQIPPGGVLDHISAGDTVIVNVFADEMNAVYGYQFDINYDRDCLEYKNRLYSDIDEIATIFATDKQEGLLVGATMIGDAKGYYGQEVPVCRVEFTVLSDFDPRQVSLSRVNLVTDDLSYLENADGWTTSITVADS